MRNYTIATLVQKMQISNQACKKNVYTNDGVKWERTGEEVSPERLQL